MESLYGITKKVGLHIVFGKQISPTAESTIARKVRPFYHQVDSPMFKYTWYTAEIIQSGNQGCKPLTGKVRPLCVMRKLEPSTSGKSLINILLFTPKISTPSGKFMFWQRRNLQQFPNLQNRF